MPAITGHSDFGAQENKVCHCSSFSPSICHEVMGLDAMTLDFWMLSFKPAFSLSSFTLFKGLFSFSSLSSISLVSSAYLRLLIFLPVILTPSLGFIQPSTSHDVLCIQVKQAGWQCVLLSQFWTSQLLHIWFCCFLTCIQVSQETGKVTWYSHPSKNFPQFFCDLHSQRL